MHKLLLFCLFLFAGTTLSLAQTEPDLNKASSYAVLGSTYINNAGISGVTGDIGLTPEGLFLDNGSLMVRGAEKIYDAAVTAALQDAQAVYTYHLNSAGAPFSAADLKMRGGLPGVYHSNGNVNLEGVIVLNGNGDVNSKFIFVINGDLTTPPPAPPVPGTGLLLKDGAQAKNIYWIVKGKVRLAESTNFQGNIIAQGDITLGSGVNLIGRAISLTGGVDLTNNNIFMPTVVIADLGVKKTAAAGEYIIGDEITYTITVHNDGPDAASGVVVTEQMPAGLEYLRSSTVKGVYDASSNKWNVGSLQNGETATLAITFRVLTAGPIENKVEVGGYNPDPDPADDNDTHPIDVPEVSANLSITKTASGAPYVVGGTITYTIEVKNAGPYTSQAVNVTDVLPAELEYISGNATQGSYNATTGSYTVGDLAKNATTTLTIIAKIKSFGTNGKVTNVAVVNSLVTPDKDLANNTDTEVIQITCPTPDLAIEGEVSVCAGAANLVYTVTDVPGATYTFTLTNGKSGGWEIVSQNRNTIILKAGTDAALLKVCVSDICGNCLEVEKAIKVTAPLATPTISGPAAVCSNTTVTYTAEGITGEASYEWVATGGLEIISGQNSKQVEVKAGLLGGTLTLVAKNTCFTSLPATKVITVKPALPATVAIVGNTNLCAGSETTYTTAVITGATGYTWAVPTGWTIISGQGTAQLKVKVGATSGNVTVTPESECGKGTTATLAIVVTSVPIAPSAIAGNTSACVGSKLTYSIQPIDGATGYTWEVPSTWNIISGQNTTTIEVTVGSGAGNITVAAKNECGNGAKASIAVAPATKPAAPGAITGTAAVCAGAQNLTYSITGTEGITKYNWTVPAGWTIVNGQGTTSITVTAGISSGDISVTATGSCGTSAESKLAVTITALPAAPGPIADNSNVCDGLKYSIDAVAGATSYTWAVPAGFTITSGQGTTAITVKATSPNAFGEISVTASNGTCEGGVATAAINAALADGELSFPKAISPNGDGKNDTWIISNLRKFPVNEVVIFNRWGSEVYRRNNYQDDWAGNGLEQGTYFYKVKVQVCNGVQKEFTGYVTIFR